MQQLIQTMIAPAVMISCCGLLQLALISKLGRVIDRIRILNSELRTIKNKLDSTRKTSIERQIAMLVDRALLLKHSSTALFLAIFFFVLTSFGIGLFTFWERLGTRLALICFIIGMICLLLGVLYAYWEIRSSHKTIVEEIRETAEIIKKDLEG